MYICKEGQFGVVELNGQLKDFSNNVNVQEENGMTPLVENCMYGY